MTLEWSSASDWDAYQSADHVTHAPTPEGIGDSQITIGYDPDTLPASANLEAYWPLTDASGAEEVVNGYAGTVNGASAQTGANIWSRGCYEFDGTDDYLSFADQTQYNQTGDFTIAAWYYITNLSDTQDIIAKRESGGDANYAVRAEPATNRWRIFHSDSGGTYESSLFTHTFTSGTWEHITVTWDDSATEYEVYIDFSSLGTDPNREPTTTTAPLTIGAEQDSAPDDFWHGNIAHVMLWDTKLSATQVGNIGDATEVGTLTTAGKTA